MRCPSYSHIIFFSDISATCHHGRFEEIWRAKGAETPSRAKSTSSIIDKITEMSTRRYALKIGVSLGFNTVCNHGLSAKFKYVRSQFSSLCTCTKQSHMSDLHEATIPCQDDALLPIESQDNGYALLKTRNRRLSEGPPTVRATQQYPNFGKAI